MTKQIQIRLMVGAVCLFAGIAQAETPAASDYVDPGYVNGGHFSGWTESQRLAAAEANRKEAAAPAAAQVKPASADNTPAKNPEDELSPEARPVYLNGGHWGE